MPTKKIINLTPHSVKIVGENGEIVAEYPSQGTCRVTPTFKKVGELNGTPVFKTTFGETQGLPEPDGETIFIVSMVVAQANPKRTDIVSPNTSPGSEVRNDDGTILGVKSFSQY